MKENRLCDVHAKDLNFIHSFIARFPMSCACLEAVIDPGGAIVDYVFTGMNHSFASITEIHETEAIGKNASAVFGLQNAQVFAQLMALGNQAYLSDTKTGEASIRLWGHAYKTSFFFISGTLLFCVLEDIQAQFNRRYYRRSIPHHVISTIILKRKSSDRKPTVSQPEPISEASLYGENTGTNVPKSIEIIQNAANFTEPCDASFRDPLTGLYDRSFGVEALRMYIDLSVTPLSVALGDVNGLQSINETLGYSVGDDILVKIAKTISQNCRSEDVVARWTDDEFMLVMPYVSQEDMQRILTRLQNSLNQLYGNSCNLVTFGSVTSGSQLLTAEDYLLEAERWIHQKKLLEDQSHRSNIVRLLLTILHEKNTVTQEHSERMADHCRWIAHKLSLSDEMLDDLLLLSMLHDIGKVGIPDSILNKPGPLTPEERQIIQQHPEIGRRITQTVPELNRVSAYIFSHHERWDGDGYPNRLKGEEIPIASRIIAVVDAYDVMVTGRNYRAARTKKEAIEELQRCSGTQFDPGVVAAYIELLSETVHDEETDF